MKSWCGINEMQATHSERDSALKKRSRFSSGERGRRLMRSDKKMIK